MRLIDYKESLKILNKYRIRPIDTKIYSDRATKTLKYPVVLKAYSSAIIHKNKAGLVKTGILNEKELISNYKDIVRILKRIKSKKHEIILQKQVKGKEFIIGAKKDLTFGSVVIFGLGGIYADILKSFAIRINPINKKMAFKMIKDIDNKISKHNMNKLANIIQKMARLVEKETISEIDLNPVIVNEKDAIIVDVRIVS